MSELDTIMQTDRIKHLERMVAAKDEIIAGYEVLVDAQLKLLAEQIKKNEA